MGHRVPERRVYATWRTDKVLLIDAGTMYHICNVSYLWHVDGNMSLIRWGFVAVDGYKSTHYLPTLLETVF